MRGVFCLCAMNLDKHSSHIRSAGQINSLTYKLTKAQ